MFAFCSERGPILRPKLLNSGVPWRDKSLKFLHSLEFRIGRTALISHARPEWPARRHPPGGLHTLAPI